MYKIRRYLKKARLLPCLNFRIKTKKPRLFSRDCYFFLSTIIKRWFPPFGFHTLPGESFRLQFPFVFRRLQSLQMLLPVHPCLPLSLLTFSGPSIPQLAPLPFRFLSSTSLPGFSLSSAFFRPLLFGSDYSAFRSFPFGHFLLLSP